MADFSFSRFEAAVQRCEDLRRGGAYHEALGLYRDLLHDRLTQLSAAANGDWQWFAADMVVIEQTADLSVLCGHPDAADDLLDAAVSLVAGADNHYAAAYALLKRVHLALERGQLRRAYKLLTGLKANIGDVDEIDFTPAGLGRWEAACRWPGVRPLDRRVLFTRLYLCMARILAGLGQYRDALACHERGLQHAGTAAPELARVAAPHLRIGRAAALLELGRLDEAGAALDGLAEAVGGQPGMTVRRLELAGKLDLVRGRFGNALRSFEEVQAICRRYGFDRAAIAAALNLAHIFIYLNQTYRARLLLDDAAAMAGRLGEPAFVMRARCLLDLASARARSLSDAVPIAPSVLELWGGATQPDASDPTPAGPDAGELLDTSADSNYLSWFEDRALGFYWQLSRRDLPAAASVLEDMRATFGATDSSIVRGRLGLMEGVLSYYQHEYESAARRLEDAVRAFEALGLRPELWQARRFLGWCWARTGRAQGEVQALARRTGELMAELAASLEGPEQAMYLLNKWTAEEEAFASEINELAGLREAAAGAGLFRRALLRRELRRRVRDLLGKIDRYKGSIADRGSGSEGAKAVGSRSGFGLRGLFGRRDDRVMLSFLVLPDRVFVARQVGRALDFGLSPVTRLDLRDLVRQWHETARDFVRVLEELLVEDAATASQSERHLAEIEAAREAAAERLAAALQLQGLLSGLPASASALTIVPDDCLHGLPFAALRYEGQYLLERYAVSLAFESTPRPLRATAPTGVALAVTVSQGFGDDYGPLPEAVGEAEAISSLLREKGFEVRRLSDEAPSNEAPTKGAVLAHLSDAEVFHIGCHGRFEPNALEQTGLLLPGATAGQAELLSLPELLSLDLARLQHATLTACWSADNYILPGRWIISLPEVVWRAGAGSVLGNLWLSEDSVAAALTERFYRYLGESPREEALRRAQLDCLRGELLPDPFHGTIGTSNPVFWAGYRIYGQPGRLSFTRARGRRRRDA